MEAEERKLQEELSVLLAGCPKKIVQETNTIFYHLSLIQDLIVLGGMDKWMTIWSTINILTDGGEVEKLTTESGIESLFYRSPRTVQELLEALQYWLAQEIISRQNTLWQAARILSERWEGNLALLKP